MTSSHSESQFVFHVDPEPLACVDGGANIAAGVESFEERVRKWGFALAHSPSTGTTSSPTGSYNTVLARYSYASSSPASPFVHFHDGLAGPFLDCLFASAVVQRAVPWLTEESEPNATPCRAFPRVRFHPLTCRWTSLQPIEDALVAAKVVRRLCVASTTASPTVDMAGPRLPTVKRPEQYLASGLCVADELRALCLLTRPTGTERDDDMTDTDEEVEDWGGGGGRGMTRHALRAAVPADVREELLYQLVANLAVGGGVMNQYEDHLDAYLEAARELYRSCVTSLEVCTVTRQPLSAESDAEGRGVAALDEDDHDTAPATASANEAVYEPMIVSRAFAVQSVGSHAVKPLTWSSDGRTPAEFCVVVVNPLEQTVVVWAHRSVF